MKKSVFYLIAFVVCIIVVAAFKPKPGGISKRPLPAASAFQSITALAFAPDGTLFVGDSKQATVFAVKLKDVKALKVAQAINIKQVNAKIAAALGTDAVTITDMAVNPISKVLYIAVQDPKSSTPVLLKMNGEKPELVKTEGLTITSVALNNAPAEDAKDQRGRPIRMSTISDLGFDDGKLLVSGLSNHEFSSSFKSIPYPFTDKQDESTLEIYHAAHGRYETSAPIRTFTTGVINNRKYLIASYTCTPLVMFPMDELQPGKHVKGRTVAEMGSGNSPIDMLTLGTGSESFLLMANTKHPVAKVDYKNIAAFEGTLTDPVKGTAGVNFKATPTVNVLQMDKLGDHQVLMMQLQTNGDLDLVTSDDSSL
ncbi:MAG: hypothetical protein EOO02_13265 [Chitinophagaceae bacterium]|nr:MAG: hypothetical protein EOO02_13265 [Chitinophagaceae bacterium]